MQAFFIGLLFLLVVLVLVGVGILLYPLLFIFGMILRGVVILALVLFAIWLLGKIILFVWEKINGPDEE